MVNFDESISGLDQGSPVKLRGVRVGHVVGISIRYDRATGKSLAAVLCELNHGSITDEHGANFDVSDRAALQDRCAADAKPRFIAAAHAAGQAAQVPRPVQD